MGFLLYFVFYPNRTSPLDNGTVKSLVVSPRDDVGDEDKTFRSQFIGFWCKLWVIH
jgi:hypothetical protein